MAMIEIDDELYAFLQKHAVPLSDNPNTVLRRLLLGNAEVNAGKDAQVAPLRGRHDKVPEGSLEPPCPVSSAGVGGGTESFTHFLMENEFREHFTKVSGFRSLYTSPMRLVYFQNFNKLGNRLWYRVAETPYNTLRTNLNRAILCLTNGAERISYVIPVEEIYRRAIKINWRQNYLQINIYRASHRWTEFDWNLEEYFRKY